MMVTKELIEQFFRNECTAEEQEQVWAFFKTNPEEFARYFNENEWSHFEAGVLDDTVSAKMFETVRQQTIGRRNRARIARRLAIAASLVLIVGLGWIYLAPDGHKNTVANVPDKKNDSALVYARHEVNNSGRDKSITLEDGSLITLANNSELTYQLPFVNSRNITLVGKAYFKVAKDKTKPFCVFSGDISTTALGTEFNVTAMKNVDRIIVRLYEGKIVVKAVQKNNPRMKKDFYLLPGQELVYGGPGVVVNRFGQDKTAVSKPKTTEEEATENPSIAGSTKKPYFMFNNRPLYEVLDQLNEIYNVKIIYNKKDLENIYLIGKYENTTPVETILKRIATLNNLTITKQDSTFIISR